MGMGMGMSEVGMNGSKRKKNKPNMHRGTILKYWAALNQNFKFLWKRDERTVIGAPCVSMLPVVCLVTP